MPLLRLGNGAVLQRDAVATVVGLAALSQGIDEKLMGSHSLRIGGATAMYHVTRDLKLVQRYGRWASDAFQGYLWEADEAQQGLARDMGRDAFTLSEKPGAR